MIDTRKKASMPQVLADIKPYISKKFMAAPCIKEQDKNYLHGYASSTAQSRNTPGMTGMLCCGTTTIINGMV